MKTWHWQALFILLCIWDTFATQTILASNITHEGNPLMDTVIQTSGWIPVWAIKIGLGTIVAWYIPILWPKVWGKLLIIMVFSLYLFVALVHLFLFQLPH